MLAIEDAASGFPANLSLEGYTPAQMRCHAYLLVDAGVARGTEVTHMGSQAPEFLITA